MHGKPSNELDVVQTHLKLLGSKPVILVGEHDVCGEFTVLQLIWPDKDNKWPWEESFNENWKLKQPLLDRNIDYKFYEQRDLGVYTTQHV